MAARADVRERAGAVQRGAEGRGIILPVHDPFGSTVDPDPESDVGWATEDGDAGPASAESIAGAPPQQFGRFRLLRLLGQGGMGVVHAAYDGQLDRVVALKMVRGDRGSAAVIGRFIREAKALAKLSHPNVVQIFDVSTLRGDVFLAMEYVRGRTLREEMVARRRAGDTAGIVDLFIQAGRGLAAVHAAGLVHRDFKPDNVMVGDDGRVRVMDFGLARASDAPSTAPPAPVGDEPPRGDVALTAVGSIVGTPAYMSPEQHRGAVTDARSDVFSFCAALYEGLLGAPPFAPGDYTSLRAAAPSPAPLWPAEERPPAWLREVVLRGLRVDPAERWPALEPLLAALAADPLEARRRSRRRLGFAAAIAALAVAATFGGLALQRSRERARVEALAAEHLAGVEAHSGEQAEAAFAVFVADPAHQGTRAIAQAWRGQGDRRRAAGDREGALAAYARAYAEAREPVDAQAAMRAIVEVDVAAGEVARLGRAVEALAVDPNDRGLVDLVVEAHLLRRDPARAIAAMDGAPAASLAGARPILAALARGRALPLSAHGLELLPEGPDAAAAVHPSAHELTVLDRALAPARRWTSDVPISLVPGAPWAVTTRGGSARLFDVRAPERTLATLPAPRSELYPRAFVDGDGDGDGELYFLQASPVMGFKVLADLGGPVRVAHPASEATGSVLLTLAAADLDGDGTQEVVATFGAFSAYDLRVFHARPSGELDLLARRTVGHAPGLAVLRRPDGDLVLAVAVDAGSPNDGVFPEPPHLGPPAGLYLFDWTGQELVERASFAPPGPVEAYGLALLPVDLDGDGRDELVVPATSRGHRHAHVARQLDDGDLEQFVLGDTLVLAAGQLDDDPARELFVADWGDASVWALGLGDEPRPPVASPPREPVVAPPELTDEVLLARLARADELDAVGLPGGAAEVVRDAAALVADLSVRRRLLDRAARLLAAAGEPERALELGAQVEDDPELAGAALTRRVELLTELGRFAEAAGAAERLREVAAEPAQQAAADAALTRLRPLLDDADAVEVRFAGPLDPAWQVERPAALRRDPADEVLRVDAIGRQVALASLPLRYEGGPLQLEVELDVRHAEHNTSLHLSLVDERGRSWFGVGAMAGGSDRRDLRHHSASCQPMAQASEEHVTHLAAPTAATRHRVIVRAVFFPDRATSECVVVDDGLRSRNRYTASEAPPPGRYTLRLGGADFRALHRIAADLRSISVRGARIDRGGLALDPLQTAAHALVEGEPLAALSALVATPADAPGRAPLELLAYDDLGDRRGLEASARPALAGLDLADRVHLLRTRPGLAPWVREASGADLPELLAGAWGLLAWMHDDDPAVQSGVLEALRGVEGLTPADDDDRAALAELLAARGQIHHELGAADRAWRDREAALELLAACSDAAVDPLRAELHEDLAVSLAALDPARALRHAELAVARDPSPELMRERLGRHRAIAERAASEPAWRALIGASR